MCGTPDLNTTNIGKLRMFFKFVRISMISGFGLSNINMIDYSKNTIPGVAKLWLASCMRLFEIL